MPLFGKKKDSKQDEKEKEANKQAQAAASYPRQTAPPGAYPVAGGYSAPPPQYSAVQPPPQNQPPPPYSATGDLAAQGPMTVVAPDAFDAGARFNHGARPTIPPPPPGMMPNAVQLAAAQGHTVVAGQRQETVMGGTGDAGYVVW